MPQVTGEDVLKALHKDLRFTSMTVETFAVLIPFVLQAPEALGPDLLSAKADVSTFLQAKIVFLEYSLKRGFAEKTAALIASTFEVAQKSAKGLAKKIKDLELPSTDKLSQLVKEAMGMSLVAYRGTLAYMSIIQKKPNQIKQEILIGFGMTKETAMRCLKEDLTIADLLLIEPGSILINSNSNKK